MNAVNAMINTLVPTAFSVAKSPKVDKIYCAPGNAGIASLAELVPITAMEFDKLADFAEENKIDLTIIGMDDPLVGGIVDVFEKRGLRVFGPTGGYLFSFIFTALFISYYLSKSNFTMLHCLSAPIS